MRIDSYRFGEIVIDGRPHRKDLKIIRGEVKAQWWREAGHELKASDLADVMAARPKILIVGTGASGMMRLAPGLRAELEEEGIRLEAVKTAEAAVRFGELVSEMGQDAVAAAFHLTC